MACGRSGVSACSFCRESRQPPRRFRVFRGAFNLPRGWFSGWRRGKRSVDLYQRLRDLWSRFVLVFTAFSSKKKCRTGENPVRLRGRGTFCRAGCVLPTPEDGRACRGEADALARYFSCVRGIPCGSAANLCARSAGDCRRRRQASNAELFPPSRFLFSASILQGRKKFLKSDQSSHGLASPSCRAGQSSLTSPKSCLPAGWFFSSTQRSDSALKYGRQRHPAFIGSVRYYGKQRNCGPIKFDLYINALF